MSEITQNLESVLFEAAIEKLSAAERAAFLDGACRDDPALRARLEVLLEGHFGGAGFLPEPQKRAAPSSPPAAPRVKEAPARKIGRYKLLEKIGEGGMGEVWMAEQEQPIRRRVALKLVKVGMDTRSVVARFEAEGQALALMDHPNIARVFDAGATDTGRPYLVMELVRGIRITDYCDEHQLSTRDRLDLFIQVCQAIQHAHQKGIIHRDLKPSNILVTVNDGVPVPKVIDFGIAKAIAQKLTDKTLFTEFQALVGTPAYMSPEQVDLSSVDIDTRSDIYSLGVLLYELLVGRTPFDAAEMMREGFDVLWRTIREKEPVKPSTRLRTLPGVELTTTAQRRRTDALKLTHLLRGDLDWIVMKCLEKDRARRYETANGLAMDIRRYLDNEPIIARPPSPVYRLQKALRRNKLAFTAATLVALALAVGGGAVIVVQHRANQDYRQRFYAYQMGRAGAALTAGQFDHLGVALAQCPPEHRHWEWRYLNSQVDRWRRHTVFQTDAPVRKLVMSRDGALVALMAGGQNGRIQAHRFPSGERLSTIDVLTSVWAPWC
jgi:serine/threonine protein kinase